MYKIIKLAICHPKMIVMLFKEKISRVVGYVLILFGISILACGLKNYSTNHFDYDNAKQITTIITLSDKGNVSYDSNTSTLSGDVYQTSAESVVINALNGEAYSQNRFVFNFLEKGVTVYFSKMKIAEVKYTDIDCKSFTFENVSNGVVTDTVHMQQMLDQVLDRANVGYSKVSFFIDVLFMLLYYAIIIVCSILLSIFVNPDIAKDVRFKLIFFSTGIYFVIMSFYFIFGAELIQYLAFLFPMVYCNITFAHIIRIRKV